MDLNPSEFVEHRVGRTITEYDNIHFTLMTNNSNEIHFNNVRGAESEFGKCLVNSTLTLAVVTGLTVDDVSRNGINLGWEQIELLAPVFPGDTLFARTRVLAKRPSKSRPGSSIVKVETEGYNQDGVVVVRFRRDVLRPSSD